MTCYVSGPFDGFCHCHDHGWLRIIDPIRGISARDTVSCHSYDETETTSENGCVVLVGNPNVGKSVIFGALTGRYVTVSNYPGTTVEITRGALPDGTPLIDTPGINSLYGIAADECVTRDVLQGTAFPIRAVVQVADAKNLRRA